MIYIIRRTHRITYNIPPQAYINQKGMNTYEYQLKKRGKPLVPTFVLHLFPVHNSTAASLKK